MRDPGSFALYSGGFGLLLLAVPIWVAITPPDWEMERAAQFMARLFLVSLATICTLCALQELAGVPQ